MFLMQLLARNKRFNANKWIYARKINYSLTVNLLIVNVAVFTLFIYLLFVVHLYAAGAVTEKLKCLKHK